MPATTSTLAFFSSSASSFQPAPYTPASSQSSSSRPSRTTQRSHDSLAMPPAGMDPQVTDPNVLFLHPPFASFPNSHLHPEGLTYSLMAENPEWFLDAHDFISQPSTNSNATPYPPHLEPPRGWCPARKKDLKDRGGEGWPEGEEPRLRCTFCRRTYAGVNAKSMWRRHVFEKHKIAMANRRDGTADRPRGRGSGKENRHHAPVRVRDETHDSVVTMIVAPQTVLDSISHKSRFRSGKSTEVPTRRQDREPKREKLYASISKQQPVESPSPQSDEESEGEDPTRARSPPLTPHAEISSDPSYALGRHSDEAIGTSPSVPLQIIPESPYNPLQTPSFRHSPPPLPSDQPWRYPSPSHPLHSNTRDLSLTIVARPLPSPTKGVHLTHTSPLTMLPMHSSPLSLSTPLRPSIGGFETPARSTVLGSKSINKLLKGYITSPLGTTKSYALNEQTLGSSPLRKSLETPRGHSRQRSDLSETWFSDSSLDHTSTPLTSTNNDPFSIYDSWVGGGRISPVQLPKARPEPDSPVLRCGSSTSSVGLGIGLLEPFVYPTDDTLNTALDIDLKEILTSPDCRKTRSEGKRSAIHADPSSAIEINPPLKKRRMSPETTDI
ncbi:hypothetical protein BJ912DRAFT_1131885 [Pholiota molesta]|nr:hypothetical protein BJ912DRAFT_1131885 [Pholiota molesta]